MAIQGWLGGGLAACDQDWLAACDPVTKPAIPESQRTATASLEMGGLGGGGGGGSLVGGGGTGAGDGDHAGDGGGFDGGFGGFDGDHAGIPVKSCLAASLKYPPQ